MNRVILSILICLLTINGYSQHGVKFLEGDLQSALNVAKQQKKMVFVDVYTSWCGPCRQEIPHLKEAFEAYNEKGVEFLSVSIDKDGNAWRKAMKDENMPWAQVQAPKAGKDVMKLYQFSGIPYILVLDQEGRIVGKNLRGQKLMDKLEEMVNGGAKKSVAMPAMGM